MPFGAFAEPENDDALILEVVVQKYYSEDYAYVYQLSDREYLSLSQMADYVGLRYKIDGKILSVWYANTPEELRTINFLTHQVKTPKNEFTLQTLDYQFIDKSFFFSTDFWQKFLDASVEVDFLNMSLKLDRNVDFPVTAKRKAEKKRADGIYDATPRPISDYEFDERLFGAPVVDLSLSKGWSKYDGMTSNSDSYSVNMAMLAGGLDVEAYISGSMTSNQEPQIRIKGSRTFLSEPSNALNLKALEIGDINGLSSSYFTNSSYGRGVALSSFKNLVMSADKTIDITGPLSDGWQVELYWNDQLVGYRQNGVNGQYNFPKMPVSYGLNTFKLVFYGPYGETRTEYEKYYSGTSPVKKGEFGYNMAAYQPFKHLIETEADKHYFEKAPSNVLDLTGYYGLTDRVTLMGGYTQTPNSTNLEKQQFAMAGAQYAIQGTTLQYNLEQNLDTDKLGHHVEWQGDINIGQIYTGYDKYNKIHSPISSYGYDYLEEQIETRLTGNLPYNVPYYLSVKQGKLEESKQKFNNFSARVSKYLTNGLNLSLEDEYYDYMGGNINNVIKLGAYKWWGDFSSEAYLSYQTKPQRKLSELTTRLDYRTGRNTYISGEYAHNFIQNMDYFRLSAGQVFPFGGLTATFETDRDFNLSSYLTYNISFAKEPDKMDIIATGNSKLSQTGTMYVKLFDEKGEPLDGVGINANGLEKQVYTNEDGVAILNDLQTYEKTTLRVDLETLIDVALTPEIEEKRVILHPGTIRTVELPFIHRGAIEGALENADGIRMFGYQITAVDKTDTKKEYYTFADVDGYFILDQVPYGEYNLVISKDGQKLAERKDIKIDDVVVYVDDIIKLETAQNIMFGTEDTDAAQTESMKKYENGYNIEDYFNHKFPIDVKQNVVEPDKYQYAPEIESNFQSDIDFITEELSQNGALIELINSEETETETSDALIQNLKEMSPVSEITIPQEPKQPIGKTLEEEYENLNQKMIEESRPIEHTRTCPTNITTVKEKDVPQTPSISEQNKELPLTYPPESLWNTIPTSTDKNINKI